MRALTMIGARFEGRAIVTLGAAAIVLALVGCTGSEPTPTDSASFAPSPTSSEVGASPTPTPSFQPAGDAADNLAYFDAVNQRLLSATPTPGGRAIIDNLVSAGFDKAAMQVTPDETTIGNAVDSVQFSVRIGGDCLIGQSSGAGYTGTVGPVADGTSCLIGTTRVIDW